MKTSGNPQPIRDLFDVSGNYSGSPAVSVSANGVLVQRELPAIDERVDALDRTGTRLGSLAGLPSGIFGELHDLLELGVGNLERLLRPLPLGDILRHTDDPLHLPLLIPHYRARKRHRDLAPVSGGV